MAGAEYSRIVYAFRDRVMGRLAAGKDELARLSLDGKIGEAALDTATDALTGVGERIEAEVEGLIDRLDREGAEAFEYEIGRLVDEQVEEMGEPTEEPDKQETA